MEVELKFKEAEKKGSYHVSDIAQYLHSEAFVNDSVNTEVNHLLFDSRKLTHAASTLFFALKGEHKDGHTFIDDLVTRGVRNFIISDKNCVSKLPDCNYILVNNTKDALQSLAAIHRQHFQIPMIAITGSNGKTSVKEWLYLLLRHNKNVVRSPKSYNSQIGVPLSVWGINHNHELGIFEAGISQKGEMEKLEEILKPTIGIITNIGEAHSQNFDSRLDKASEKVKLFKDCKTIIYNKDYAALNTALRNYKNKEYFTISHKSNANLKITNIEKQIGNTIISGIFKHETNSITIPFTDNGSIENAITCWALMLYLNYNSKVISEQMQGLSPVAMRLELKQGINNCSIINDSYNSDLGSIAIALDFLSQQKQHDKHTVILSDVLQSGDASEALYSNIANLIKQKNVNRFIGIGLEIKKYAHLFDRNAEFHNSTLRFLHDYDLNKFDNESILIKGARKFTFEKITEALQGKAHDTILEIDLNAFAHNLNFYRSKLKPKTKLMVMVKAFTYGSGSFEIANLLQFHHVDYLAVAYTDEGISLRKAGIKLPIMVMNPEQQGFDAMIKNCLEPEIYSLNILNKFDVALQRKGIQNWPVHIKLDTGMHRLGFEEKDLDALTDYLNNHDSVKVKTVFTHLASADNPVDDAFTKIQLEKFELFTDIISESINDAFDKHVLNSAGILRYNDEQFEMVRLGIGLHGISSVEEGMKNLEPVATLITTISQVKTVSAGDSVGYGTQAKVIKETTIATVAIGYADGYDRRLGNGVGYMMIKGNKVNTLGNICMDMSMLDVSGLDVREGDEVLVFGKELPITELATKIGTIPYELLTNISERVKRVYYHE